MSSRLNQSGNNKFSDNRKYTPTEIMKRRDSATKIQNAYRIFLARIDIAIIRYTLHLQTHWTVEKIFNTLISKLQISKTIEYTNNNNSDKKEETNPSMHFGVFLQFVRLLRLMDNEINHTYLYGIFNQCCEFTANYPKCVEETIEKLNIPRNTFIKNFKYYDTSKRPEEEPWLSFLGKHICKQQAYHGGNLYSNFRYHTETKLSIVGFWIAIYALTYSEMPHIYTRDGPQAAVQMFLQRYVYRSAEETFNYERSTKPGARKAINNAKFVETTARTDNQNNGTSNNITSHIESNNIDIFQDEEQKGMNVVQPGEEQKKWYDETHYKIYNFEGMLHDSSEKFSKELLFYERSIRNIFCKYATPYFDYPEKQEVYQNDVERALDEMDIYTTDSHQKMWLECLCSPKEYALDVKQFIEILIGLELLDQSDVKGHAKAVCCFASASTRQSLGFGTSFAKREHSIYPTLHRTKQLLVTDIADYVLDNNEKNAVAERIRRSGRGWGPPPSLEQKMRDLYFQNHELKESEKYELQLLFSKLDSDNSGFLDHHEIEQIALRFAGPERTVGEVYTCLRMLDKDSDGRVTIDELERTIVLANALHRQIKACKLSMPEFQHAFAFFIIYCTIRTTRKEMNMDNAEYFQSKMKSLTNYFKLLLGKEMIEVTEASVRRKKEMEDLGLPELVDSELVELEEKFNDIVYNYIHDKYCKIELSAGTHSFEAMNTNTEDQIIVETMKLKHEMQAKKSILFQDGWSTFVNHCKLYPNITENEKIACFNIGLKKQHSRKLNPRRRTGLLVSAGNFSKNIALEKMNIYDQKPRPPVDIDGLNVTGMKLAIKHVLFKKFVYDCHKKGQVPFIGVYAIDIDIADATETDLEQIYHASYVKNGKIQSFYGDYFKQAVERLHVLFVVYQPQRVFGINSTLGASHFQTNNIWKNQRYTSKLKNTFNRKGGNKEQQEHTDINNVATIVDRVKRDNPTFWYNDKPIVHEKNRLAKSTRYSQNALTYYQNAVDVLSDNQTLANSFETYIQEQGKFANRGYSVNTRKYDDISPAIMVHKMKAEEEDEKSLKAYTNSKKKKKVAKGKKKKKRRKKGDK
jgi:hypothetical protein